MGYRAAMADQTRPDPAAFAAWLRSLAKRRGYDPEARGDISRLAVDAGVARSILSKALSGSALPSVESLKRLATPLGVTLGDMQIAAGIASRDDFPSGPTDLYQARVEQYVRGLPPHLRDAFRERAQSIRDETRRLREQRLAELADMARLADGSTGTSE